MSVRRFISKVNVQFGAFDRATRGSREFLRQWSSKKVAAEAPDMQASSPAHTAAHPHPRLASQVSHKVRTDGGPPLVQVQYSESTQPSVHRSLGAAADGHKVELDVSGVDARAIAADVEDYARNLGTWLSVGYTCT